MAEYANGTAAAHANGKSVSTLAPESCPLRDGWALRNAMAQSLLLAEHHMQRLVEQASIAELIVLVEEFSPSRSTGPDWTRTFEPLVERLWAWCDDARLAALEAEFQARGMPWMAVANAFAPERGAEIRRRLRQPAWARLRTFTIG